MNDFRIEDGAVRFWLKVKPRSSRERLTLATDGEMRLELHAPPAEGEANEACIRFFAGTLRLPKGSVSILAGLKSRRKLVQIRGEGSAEIADRLRALAQQGSGGGEE